DLGDLDRVFHFQGGTERDHVVLDGADEVEAVRGERAACGCSTPYNGRIAQSLGQIERVARQRQPLFGARVGIELAADGEGHVDDAAVLAGALELCGRAGN